MPFLAIRYSYLCWTCPVLLFLFYFLRTPARGLGGGGRPDFLFLLSFPCSADHGRDWPPCKVLFRVSNQYAEKQQQQQQQDEIFRRSAVSCADSSDNVHLNPTYDASCNLASSGDSCGVSELHLSVRDRVWCTSDEQTPRPPSSAYTQWFRPRHHLNSFIISLAIRALKVALS